MQKTSPRRFVALRIVANVAIVVLAFALIPMWVVPATATIPAHFSWRGLGIAAFISYMATYGLWTRR